MRCYFNLANCSEQIPDLEGIEVSSLAQAHMQALKAVQELREEDEDGEGSWIGWRLEVTDGDGHLMFVVDLGKSLS
jgi:hypothetical protein